MTSNLTMERKNRRFIWKIQNYSGLAENVKMESPFFNTGTIKWSLALQKKTWCVDFTLLGRSEISIKCTVVCLYIDVISEENGREEQLVRLETAPETTCRNESYKLEGVYAATDLLSENLVDGVLTLRIYVTANIDGKFTACECDSATSKLSSSIESLYSDIKSYRLTHNSGDVVLHSGQQQFRVHKFILAARSPVFQRMFANDMQENLHSAVSIPDVSVPVLSQMISYMYGQEVDDSFVCIGLYSAADKYCMQDLKQRCARGLERSLTVEMVCEVAAMAHLHQDGPLLASAKCFIFSHAAEVFCSKGWFEFATMEPALAFVIAAAATKG